MMARLLVLLCTNTADPGVGKSRGSPVTFESGPRSVHQPVLPPLADTSCSSVSSRSSHISTAQRMPVCALHPAVTTGSRTGVCARQVQFNAQPVQPGLDFCVCTPTMPECPDRRSRSLPSRGSRKRVCCCCAKGGYCKG